MQGGVPSKKGGVCNNLGGVSNNAHKVLRSIAQQLPNLRLLVLRYNDGFDFDSQ
jgi:hypothetical protein